jgi:hypothetical protein
MSKFCSGGLALGCLFLSAVSMQAGVITANFGSGSGVTGFVWPSTSTPGSSTTGVALSGPVTLGGGAIIVTGSGSGLFCVVGATAGTCGFGVATNSNAFGLGAGTDGRIDPGDTVTFTVQPGWTAQLQSFTLTGFTSGEIASFSLDGGLASTFSAPVTNVPEDTDSGLTGNFASTLAFTVNAGAGRNYSIESITLDVEPTGVPEPTTFGLAGLALAGLVMARRKLRG